MPIEVWDGIDVVVSCVFVRNEQLTFHSRMRPLSYGKLLLYLCSLLCHSLTAEVRRDLLSPLESAGFVDLPTFSILRMNLIFNATVLIFSLMLILQLHTSYPRQTQTYKMVILGFICSLALMNVVVAITWVFGPYVVPEELGAQKEAVGRLNRAVCDAWCHEFKTKLVHNATCGGKEVSTAFLHLVRKMSTLSTAWCESHFGYGGSSIIARDAMESPFEAMTMTTHGDTKLYSTLWWLQILLGWIFNNLIEEVDTELDMAHTKWRRAQTQVHPGPVGEDTALLSV